MYSIQRIAFIITPIIVIISAEGSASSALSLFQDFKHNAITTIKCTDNITCVIKPSYQPEPAGMYILFKEIKAQNRSIFKRIWAQEQSMSITYPFYFQENGTDTTLKTEGLIRFFSKNSDIQAGIVAFNEHFLDLQNLYKSNNISQPSTPPIKKPSYFTSACFLGATVGIAGYASYWYWWKNR